MNRIIAIAINNYTDPELKDLNNCITDLELLIKTFTENYQFEDVVFAKEAHETSGKNLYSLLNENLLNAFDDDSILILFAGHGTYNDRLGTTYWQPSDAFQDNPNSWFNITELLQMMKVSPAKHISVISDSCFSGAIFEPLSRDGGITAFESRISRTALTSGGIERVSDGKKGENSPFAKALTDQLLANKLDEIPFTILANNVLMSFSAETKQTPKFGGLLNVGHDGGSLILKKQHLISKKTKEAGTIETLLRSLSNLQYKYSAKENELIEELIIVRKTKNDVIQAQQYEKAADLRDKERKIIDKIDTLILLQINSEFDKVSQNPEALKLGVKIDEAYENFIYTMRKAEELYQEIEKSGEVLKIEGEQLFGFVSKDFRIRITAHERLAQLAKTDPKITLVQINPNKELWDLNRANFIENLDKGLIELVQSFASIISTAKNTQLMQKKEILINSIQEIHQLQLRSRFEINQDDFDDIVKRKNIEVSILNWVRDIN